MYCWEAAKRSQAAITELLLFRKSTGVIGFFEIESSHVFVLT